MKSMLVTVAKMEISKASKPITSAKIKPKNTTFDTVRLLIFSISAGEAITFA